MPALEKITVRGFKSIAAIEELELRPINVVIGPNGSGKSNFIGVFSFLHALREGHLQDYVVQSGGAAKLLHFGPKRTKTIRVEISFAGGTNGYKVSLAQASPDTLAPNSESVLFWDRAKFAAPYEVLLERQGKEAGISDRNVRKTAWYVKDHLGKWRVYHFHDTGPSSPLKSTADVGDNRYLRPDGSNLAAFLYFLSKKDPDAYRMIVGAVRRMAPFFNDFQLEPERLNARKIRLEWKHVGSEEYFDTSSLSDGTLRFIALSTLFLQPKNLRPSIIMIDEPELGLHPAAITLLASLVKQASKSSQVILSTQSSLLLDHFEPEDVLVAERVAGATTIKRLESAKLATWLEDYSLGQLWEKNEIGGRPSPE